MRTLLAPFAVGLFWSVSQAQTPSATVSFTPNPAHEDETSITGAITYHVMKRTGAAPLVEVLKFSTNQHSPISRVIPGIAPGDCVHVVAEVAGSRSSPSVEACFGVPPPPAPPERKIPKAVTTVTITAQAQ